MNNQLKNHLNNPDINWQYITIICFLSLLMVSGIFIYQLNQKDIEIPIIEIPKKQDEFAGWETYRNDYFGIEFKYPEGLGLQYVSVDPSGWPPEISGLDRDFVCEESLNLKTTFGYGLRKIVAIDDSSYCLTKGTEGAAGTFYSTYQYTEKDRWNLNLSFILRFSNCDNIAGADRSKKCRDEIKSFDPSLLAHKIFSTFKFLD
jgi:hypothetical protein